MPFILPMFSRHFLVKASLSFTLLIGLLGGNAAIAQIIRPELRVGSTGTTVRELQATLKLLNYYNGEVTGTYDEATVIAVYRFQKAAQLPETGVMNQATWDTLFPTTAAITESVATTTATSTTPTTSTSATTTTQTATNTTNTTTVRSSNPATGDRPLLREGMDGEAVTLLQQRLAAKGFFSGTVDGVFGPQTLQAVIAAQTAFGLDGDGIVGAQTWEKLLD